MSKRPHIAMSLAYLLVLCTGFGTGGLWPVYLNQLGADPMQVGIMNAVSGPANLAGTLLAGWLADRFRRRRETFIFACSLFAVTWVLMSRATTWQQLTALNLLAGFSFGMATNMIVIMTGLLAAVSRRGGSFGLLTLVSSLSLVVTGLTWGRIADRWGFPVLLLVDALLCAASIVLALFFVEPPLARAAAAGRTARRSEDGLGAGYYTLLVAAVLVSVASYGGGFGRSVAMSELGFSATAVGLAAAIGGAISLPVPFLLGRLSDRIGRKRLLMSSCGVGLVALPVMGFASTAWGFWGASVLLGIMATWQPLLQALATDMLPRGLVGRGLGLLGGVHSLAIVLSSLAVGAAFQGLGIRPTFWLLALALPVAIALVARVRENASVTEIGLELEIPAG